MCKELVTVIMPVYNAEKYLSEAIESILQQTYDNLEIIITNDGSTDDSLKIIKNYAERDKRIDIISRENKGLVYTLNEQLAEAHGKYIVRMDADDISDKERIYKQVKYMEENADVYLAGTYYNLLIEPGTDESLIKNAVEEQKALNDFNDSISQNIFMGYVLLHSTWIFKKELINKIGNYKEYNHCEDGEFLFRVLVNKYKIGVVKEKLFKYRIYNLSKSNNDRLYNIGIKEDIVRYHIEYFIKYMQGVFNKDYLIWGSDITGKLTAKLIQKELPDAHFIGYIDSFSEPDNEKRIFRPNIIDEHIGYYVFVATNGGRNYAIDYLEKLGRNKIEEYFVVV